MEALSYEHLLGIAEGDDDTAVWIYHIEERTVTRAIIDYTDEQGILGIWCADISEWYIGKDYNVKWRAYREKPSIAWKEEQNENL